MVDVVAGFEVVEHCNIRLAIIHYELWTSAISTKEVLEDKLSNRFP